MPAATTTATLHLGHLRDRQVDVEVLLAQVADEEVVRAHRTIAPTLVTRASVAAPHGH